MVRLYDLKAGVQFGGCAVWIDAIEIDEDNEEHVTAHGVSVSEIYQVFRNAPTIKRNRRSRSASYWTDPGVTDGGRRVHIFFDIQDHIAPPITAWEMAT